MCCAGSICVPRGGGVDQVVILGHLREEMSKDVEVSPLFVLLFPCGGYVLRSQDYSPCTPWSSAFAFAIAVPSKRVKRSETLFFFVLSCVLNDLCSCSRVAAIWRGPNAYLTTTSGYLKVAKRL
jgi:hypothetical protein